jgi:hypothetical protein
MASQDEEMYLPDKEMWLYQGLGFAVLHSLMSCLLPARLPRFPVTEGKLISIAACISICDNTY